MVHLHPPGCSRRQVAAAAFGAALLLSGPLAAADAWAQYSLVSVAQGGGAANGASRGAAISADGRFVAFSSEATNLVANDANASVDVFVRDRQANVTTRVSVTSAGAEAAGASETAGITPDGRFVVFESYAALVAGDTNSCASPAGVPTCGDIYVHDRQTSTTTRVSVSSAGVQGDGHSSSASISADGRYVVFASEATNLVAGDTNGQPDVFLHDLQTNTTTRISVSHDGSQMPRGGHSPLISEDGEIILFSGYAAEPIDRSTCDQATLTCLVVYQRVRSVGDASLSIMSNNLPIAGLGFRITTMQPRAMSADGRYIVIDQSGYVVHPTSPPAKNPRARSLLYDRVSNRAADRPFTGLLNIAPETIPDISSDGRTLAFVRGFVSFAWSDRISGIREDFESSSPWQTVSDLSISADGRYMALDSGIDVFVFDRDAGDGDSLPDAWETTFGLNPSNSADANADPDLDGLTNLQEFQQGSHPQNNTAYTRYFAEGAANPFFRTRIAAVNPGDTAAAVVFRFLGGNGQTFSMPMTLPPKSRRTIFPSVTTAPFLDNDFSTVVESNQQVVVDRTMTWGFAGDAGGHAETSEAAPSTTWHFAEGATHGAFDLFYLFQNPNPSPATVTVTYLRLDPATPITRTYEVAANSRRTIWVDDEGPDLAAVDLGASITSDLPIVAERAMYSTRPGQTAFEAGHGGAGVTAPAPRWFLAEGATGGFFDLYLLIANPNTTASNVKVTFLLGNGGESFSKDYTVGAQTRRTLTIADEDPRLAGTSVSMIVETTNNQPLVVERAMWWPKGQWYESHLSAGATSTGTRWAVADGEVALPSSPNPWETYILIANTSATQGSATVSLLPEDGDPIVQTVDLPPNSRVNVPFSSLFSEPPPYPYQFGAIVESNGVEIVVERAMYQTTNGLLWGVGTASLATKLQ
jgi:hypothetical protein